MKKNLAALLFLLFSSLLSAQTKIVSAIVYSTVFIKDLNDFGKMNAVYASEFGDHKPARSAVQVARLPKDVLIEIECIAVK